jgi:hypothetical protein
LYILLQSKVAIEAKYNNGVIAVMTEEKKRGSGYSNEEIAEAMKNFVTASGKAFQQMVDQYNSLCSDFNSMLRYVKEIPFLVQDEGRIFEAMGFSAAKDVILHRYGGFLQFFDKAAAERILVYKKMIDVLHPALGLSLNINVKSIVDNPELFRGITSETDRVDEPLNICIKNLMEKSLEVQEAAHALFSKGEKEKSEIKKDVERMLGYLDDGCRKKLLKSIPW